jgi:hypothetical protein
MFIIFHGTPEVSCLEALSLGLNLFAVLGDTLKTRPTVSKYLKQVSVAFRQKRISGLCVTMETY